MSSVASFVFGDEEDAGVLGTGQFRAKEHDINEGAFKDTTARDHAVARTDQYQTVLNQQMAAASNQKAPTANTTDMGAANLTGTTQANNAIATASTIDPRQVKLVNTAQIAPTATYGGAQLAPTERAAATTAGNTLLGPAQTTSAANISPVERVGQTAVDRSEDAQFRATQAGLSQRLDAQSQGQGPSLAELQAKRTADRGAANALSLAASQRGASGGGLRSALATAQGANAAAIEAGAAGRIQEQFNAQQALTNLAGTARSQDLTAATTQAQLDQTSATTNAGFQNQAQLEQARLTQEANLTNTGAANTVNLEQGRLDQQVNLANADAQTRVALANAQAGNTASLSQAELTQQAELQAAAERNRAALAQAELKQQASTANAASGNRVLEVNAGNTQQVSLANADMRQQTNLANAAARNDSMQFNAGVQNEFAQTQAQLDQQVQLANLEAELAQRGMSQEQIRALLAQSGQATQMSIDAYNQQQAREMELEALNVNQALGVNAANLGGYQNASDARGNLISAGAGAFMGVLSDAKAKKEKERADTLEAFIESQQGQPNNPYASGLAKGMRLGQSLRGPTPSVDAATGAAAGQSASAASNTAGLAGRFMANTTTGTDPQKAGLLQTAVGAISDERKKEGIFGASPRELEDFMRKSKAHTYEYKDPDQPGAAPGKQFGPMSKDLKKSKVGKMFVHEGEDGYDRVDPHLTLANTAALNVLNDKINKMEQKNKKKRIS